MYSVLTQAVGFVALMVQVMSYQMKTNRELVICKMCADILWLIHYLMLGAYSGCTTLVVAILNALIYSRRQFNRWANWKGWRWVLSAVLIIACCFTWQSSVPFWANICSMISMGSVNWFTWSDDPWLMRVAKLICVGPPWVVYCLVVGSPSGVICELMGMLSAAIGLYRYRKLVRHRENKETDS